LCFGPSAGPVLASVGSDQMVSLPEGPASATSLLAKLKTSTELDSPQLSSLLDREDLLVSGVFPVVPGLCQLRSTPGGQAAPMTADQLQARIKKLRSTGLFEYVEPDWFRSPDQIPNDSFFQNGSLWGLRNTGQFGGSAGVDINVVNAWSLTTGSPSIIVAVVDTGVRYTHQDLANNMWTNPGETPGDNIDNDNNGFVDDVFGIDGTNQTGDPFDFNNHGTHVSGTIAATANNPGGHVGVAYGTRIMALDASTTGGFLSLSGIIRCIQYAIDNGASVINASYGSGQFSQSEYDIISSADQADIVFVAAAGNDGQDNDNAPKFPASYDLPNIISVAAIDRNGNLAGFSNFGAVTVDLGAPGVEILSSTAASDASYEEFQGTSMAAPHVTGVVALLRSVDPSASVVEIRSRLLSTAAPLPSLDGRTATGGMVDTLAALQTVADNNLEIVISSSEPLVAGRTIPFTIRVTDLTPITGATVTGQLDFGPLAQFLDDGLGDDAQADDGIYTASLTVPGGVNPVLFTANASAPGKNPGTANESFSVFTAPGNDNFANRFILSPNTTWTQGSNRFASVETGEPDFPVEASGSSVWWEWTAPSGGTAAFSTSGSEFDTTLAVYTGTGLADLAVVNSNDDLYGVQSGVQINAQAGETYFIQVDGANGAEGEVLLNYPSPGGADLPVILAQPSGVTVLEGEPFTLSVTAFGNGPFTYQWFLNGAAISGATSSTYFVADSDQTDQGSYRVEVSNAAGTTSSAATQVGVEFIGLLPFNDAFNDAFALSGAGGQTQGTTVGATGEANEPNHAFVSAPFNSIWYEWTAPSDGALTLDTFGSNFDTTLAVYTGSPIGFLDEVASNDDSGGSLQSSVIIPVNTGTTYRIAVDGFANATGNVVLSHSFSGGVSGPDNDFFGNRIQLPSASTVGFGDNILATSEPGEPNHAFFSIPIESVWWEWTAPGDGTLYVSTLGSDFDTTLAVYSGTLVSDLTSLAFNDDASFVETTSVVALGVTAGQTVQIAVDGFAGDEGNITLSVDYRPPGVPLSTPEMLLLDDQGGFGPLAQTLIQEDVLVTVINDELLNGFIALLSTDYLSYFDFVVYAERGAGGLGGLMKAEVGSSLEAYVQQGGHLLVTGYNALGNPPDSNLEQLIRASQSDDLNSKNPLWSLSALDHPILNGPYGDFRNRAFSGTGYDDDLVVPDAGQGAVQLARLGTGQSAKIIFTDLPGNAGSVGFWNGGLSGTDTNAQPDFSNGGLSQNIFFNYVHFALGLTPPTQPIVEVRSLEGSALTDGQSINLGTFALGQERSYILELSNSGSDTLQVNSLTLGGSAASEFSLNPATGFHLLPGATQTVAVSLTPASASLRQAWLDIETNDPANGVFRLFLSGTGLVNSDGDNASDQWEVANQFDDSTADLLTLDSDGDGESDLFELFQGTGRQNRQETFGLRDLEALVEERTLSTTYRRDIHQNVVRGTPRWTTNLQDWHRSGETADGVTVFFSEEATFRGDHELVQLTAVIFGVDPGRVFISLDLEPVE